MIQTYSTGAAKPDQAVVPSARDPKEVLPIPIAGLSSSLTQLVSHRYIGVVGPRGCGKHTAVRSWLATRGEQAQTFDLDAPQDQGRFATLMESGEPLPLSTRVVLKNADFFMRTSSGLQRLLQWSHACGAPLVILCELGDSLSSLRELVTDGLAVVQWELAWPSRAEYDAMARQLSVPPELSSRLWSMLGGGWPKGLELLAQNASPAVEWGTPIHGYFQSLLANCSYAITAKVLRLCAPVGVVSAEMLVNTNFHDALPRIKASLLSLGGFVAPHANQPVFEIHPFIAHALTHTVIQEYGEEYVRELRLNAADALRRTSMQLEAAVLLAKAGDFDTATELGHQLWQISNAAERYRIWNQLEPLLPRNERDTIRSRPQDTAVLRSEYRSTFPLLLRTVPPANRSFESWQRGLNMVQDGAQATERLDGFLAWVSAQGGRAMADSLNIRPDLLLAIAALHVLRKPDAPDTAFWIDRSVAGILSYGPGSVPLPHISFIVMHLFVQGERMKLEAALQWLSAQANTTAANSDAARLRALVRDMLMLLDGKPDQATSYADLLANNTPADMRRPRDHELLLLAIGSWLGFQSHTWPDTLMLNEPAMSADVMSGRVDVGAMGLLRSSAARLTSRAKASVDVEGLRWLSSMAHTSQLGAAVLPLALAQGLALLGNAQEALSVIQNGTCPDRPAPRLLSACRALVEAYCRVLLEPGESRRQALRLIYESAGHFSHPVFAEAVAKLLNESTECAPLSAAPPAASPAPAVQTQLPAPSQLPRPISVRTFGEFRVFSTTASAAQPHSPIALHGRLSKLFQAILFYGLERPVRIEDICDEMWPDVDGDAAKSNFDSAIHRIRKAMRSNACIQVQHGRVSVSRDYCDVDVFRLEELQDVNVHLLPDAELEALVADLIEMFRGRLILGDLQIAGNESLQRRVLSLASTVVCQVGKSLLQRGNHEVASTLYSRFTNRVTQDPGVVNAWRELMLQLGDETGLRRLEHLRAAG